MNFKQKRNPVKLADIFSLLTFWPYVGIWMIASAQIDLIFFQYFTLVALAFCWSRLFHWDIFWEGEAKADDNILKQAGAELCQALLKLGLAITIFSFSK